MNSTTTNIESLLVHDRFLRSLARHLLHDDEDAVDDVVQSTWLAALEHAPDRPGPLQHWLARIARNFALRSRRADVRRRRREERAAIGERVPSAAEILERESLRREIVEAVLALDEPARSTVVLRYLEDLPPREVARRLAIPVETVRTRCKRALDELRARLDRAHGGDRRAWGAALLPLALARRSSLPWWLSSGMVIMTAKLKISLAVAALVLLGLATWQVAMRTPDRRTTGTLEPNASSGRVAQAVPPVVPQQEAAPSTDGGLDRAPLPPAERTSPVLASDLGSLVIRVRWGDDRSPAASIGVKVARVEARDSFRPAAGLTDADGLVSFAGLRPGRWRIDLDRGHPVRADVTAGQETGVEIEIPLGIDVEGVVVDGSAAPVADADIVVSAGGDVGQVVTRTGADGRFRVRDLMPRTSQVSAHKSGHAPSWSAFIDGNRGSARSLKLVLRERGSEIAGRVFDARGRTAVDAVVRVELTRPSGYRPNEDGVLGRPTTYLEARTDSSGSFHLVGVPAGRLMIRARAERSAPWQGTVDVTLDTPARIDITLLEPAAVTGSVVTADGQPATGVPVTAGESWGIMSWSVRTGDDGRFALEDVSPGEVPIEADAGERGKASATLTLAAGGSTEWRAVLSTVTGLEIRGRVVDEDGQPLPGWGLLAEPRVSSPRYDSGEARTDASGRFVVRSLGDVPHWLRLSAPGGAVISAVRDDVRPGPDEVVFRVTRDLVPTSFIVGTVVGEDGVPRGGVMISASHATLGSTGTINTQEGSGAFEFGPLPAGSYRLTLTSPSVSNLVTDAHELRSGETWDAGQVRLVSGGAVVVHLRREARGEPKLSVRRTDVQRGYAELAISGDLARSAPLAPGHYALTLTGAGIARARESLEVRSGEETVIDVVVKPGVEKTIRLHVGDTNLPALLEIVVRDATGASVVEDWAEASAPTRDVAAALLPGVYSLEVRAKDGRRATASFTIPEGATSAEALDLDIR